MKISKKLGLGFGLTIALTILLGSVALYQMKKLSDITEDICQHPLTVGYAVRDIRADILAMHSSMKDIVLAQTTEQINSSAAIVSNYERLAYNNFDIVFNNFLGNMDKVKNAYRLFTNWKVIRDEVIVLSLQGKRAAAGRVIEKGTLQVKLLLAEIEEVVNFASKKANAYQDQAANIGKRTLFTTAGLLIIIIIIGSVSSFLVAGSIVKPLGIMVARIKNLSHGNLKEKVDISSKDEMGILADSFRVLQKDLLQRTGLLEQIASGNFNTDIPPRSKKDDLGMSFFAMTTSLRKATRELQEAYDIINSGPSVAILWKNDSEWTVDFVTDNIVSLSGYTADEFISGKVLFFQIVYPEDLLTLKEEVFKHVDESDGDAEFTHKPYRIVTKNNEIKWVSEVSQIRKDLNGKVTHTQGILMDITRLKKTEETLELAKREAESANTAKSIFLANMSHELRTPLNAILGFSQVLELDRENFTERQRENLKYIKESGIHLLEMVNDILDLSMIEAGKMDIEREPFNPVQMFEHVVNIMKPLADEKNLTLELNIAPEMQVMCGDETRVKQICYNLLSNAVKFTQRGRKTGINAFKKEQKVVIEVWDQGIGIDAEDLEKIFDPFEQAGKTRDGKSAGTGLGLAITKKLIEAQGGTLKVESQKGNGSRFTVMFPEPNV